MLGRRAASESAVGDQYPGVPAWSAVQDEIAALRSIGRIAQFLEEMPAEPAARQRLHEACRDDHVGIDIGEGQRRSEERRVGKSVSVRVDLGGRRIIKKKTKENQTGRR